VLHALTYVAINTYEPRIDMIAIGKRTNFLPLGKGSEFRRLQPDTLQTAIVSECGVCVNREICSAEVHPVS